MTSKRQNPKSTKTVKKMAMLAGSMAAVGTMQANSQAAIQHTDATASPIGLSMMNDGDGATQGWDIDGDSSNDAMWSVTTSMTSSEEEVDHGKV